MIDAAGLRPPHVARNVDAGAAHRVRPWGQPAAVHPGLGPPARALWSATLSGTRATRREASASIRAMASSSACVDCSSVRRRRRRAPEATVRARPVTPAPATAWARAAVFAVDLPRAGAPLPRSGLRRPGGPG